MKRVSILLIITALFAVPLTAQSAMAGYTVGLNVGMPVVGGEYYADSGMDPVFGVVVGTPYGLPLGPFNVGVNVGLESANGLTGVFGILNASVYELPQVLFPSLAESVYWKVLALSEVHPLIMLFLINPLW